MSRLSRLRFMDTARTQAPVRRRLRSRGVPNALVGHPVLASEDVDEAAEVTEQLLGRCSLTLDPATRADFACTYNALQLLDVTMAYLDYHVPTTLEVSRSVDAYTVHMTTAGQAFAVHGGESHDITAFYALVTSPGTSYRIELGADSPQLVLRIERAAMERQLSRMMGRSLDAPIVFDPIADLTTDHALRWHGALQILSSEVVSSGSLIQQGVGAAALEELIISTLLYIQPSTYDDRLWHRKGTSGRPAVRRAIEYIDRHLAEPISLADLAEHTGASVRTVQVGFKEDLDTTPLAYIRDLRLDRVRHLLLEAMPGDGMTVTDAAQRWGFSHLGSFSAVYRHRFGERPSQTLRRR